MTPGFWGGWHTPHPPGLGWRLRSKQFPGTSGGIRNGNRNRIGNGNGKTNRIGNGNGIGKWNGKRIENGMGNGNKRKIGNRSGMLKP